MVKKIGIDVRLWSETGIGRYIRNLVGNLVNIDSENQYVLFSLSKDLESIKYQVTRGKYKSNFVIIAADIKWHSVAEQIEFPKLLNKYNLNLMHFPYFSVPVFYNKPYVVTIHDLIINNFPTGKASTLPIPFYLAKRMGYNIVLKNAISKSKKILAPTGATKREILNSYSVSDDKIVVTSEGIDASILDFKPTIFKEKYPYLLYVGNAYPHKNLERLIEAFMLFLESNAGYKLKIVGKKDYFAKKLIEKYSHKDLEFLGFVSDHELAKLYKQSVATFVPSLMEGFGLTALEAMGLGSIVCASNIPSLKEVCGKHAIYFDPMDVLSIESAMVRATSLNIKDKEEMVKSGRKHIEKFSWENMVRETIDVYNSCL